MSKLQSDLTSMTVGELVEHLSRSAVKGERKVLQYLPGDDAIYQQKYYDHYSYVRDSAYAELKRRGKSIASDLFRHLGDEHTPEIIISAGDSDGDDKVEKGEPVGRTILKLLSKLPDLTAEEIRKDTFISISPSIENARKFSLLCKLGEQFACDKLFEYSVQRDEWKVRVEAQYLRGLVYHTVQVTPKLLMENIDQADWEDCVMMLQKLDIYSLDPEDFAQLLKDKLKLDDKQVVHIFKLIACKMPYSETRKTFISAFASNPNPWAEDAMRNMVGRFSVHDNIFLIRSILERLPAYKLSDKDIDSLIWDAKRTDKPDEQFQDLMSHLGVHDARVPLKMLEAAVQKNEHDAIYNRSRERFNLLRVIAYAEQGAVQAAETLFRQSITELKPLLAEFVELNGNLKQTDFEKLEIAARLLENLGSVPTDTEEACFYCFATRDYPQLSQYGNYAFELLCYLWFSNQSNVKSPVYALMIAKTMNPKARTFLERRYFWLKEHGIASYYDRFHKDPKKARKGVAYALRHLDTQPRTLIERLKGLRPWMSDT